MASAVSPAPSSSPSSSDFVSLGSLEVGAVAEIVKIHGSDLFVQRIEEMGLVHGEPVKIVRVAPLGDPIVIEVHGYQLGLRKAQAALIEVSRDPIDQGEQKAATAYGSGEKKVLSHLAILGNPNCGKTTVFNAMTGMRQKVGNYAGVTVEKRTGLSPMGDGKFLKVVDLPGTYSLTATSPDEQVAVDVLEGRSEDLDALDGVLIVMDASNLARNLLLFTQVAERGIPMVVGLSMVDMAERRGQPVDVEKLESWLGVPVVPLNAKKGVGIEVLKEKCSHAVVPTGMPWNAEPQQKLGCYKDAPQRYKWIAAVVRDVIGRTEAKKTFSDSLDAFLVHRVFGLVVFALIMSSMFYAIYVVADPLMGAAEDLVAGLGEALFGGMAEGPLKSLMLDGVIGGVGGVLVFVPQIAVLFLCISLLEESGYLARATFLLDRLLAMVGLHGKSFIPMLSSHACAIPGIMAARSIENHRDRLATMFVAPFMSCGARLPVYALLIGVFLEPYGPFVQSMTLMSCYVLGIVVAILTALLLKKTALKAPAAAFLLELPQYQMPQAVQVARVVARHSFAFVKKAGTVILGFSILLWAALYYPRMDQSQVSAVVEAQGQSYERYEALSKAELAEDSADAQLLVSLEEKVSGAQAKHSWAGRAGQWMEPLIEPMGYDWKMGIGLIGAFAAREVFVSTMGIVYAVGEADEESEGLHDAMKGDLRADGTVLWTLPTVLSVLVFFVIAMQCISTVAVMKKETLGWKWPLIQLFSMNILAYVLATLVYQIGSLL